MDEPKVYEGDEDWDEIARLVTWQIAQGQHWERKWPPSPGVLPPQIEA